MALDVDALLRVAPETIDPEQAYEDGNDAVSDGSGSDSEMPEQAARRHYVDVGASKMRKARLTDSDALDHGRYSGVKTSRAEMFGDDDEEEDEEEDEDQGGDEALEDLDDEEEESDESNAYDALEHTDRDDGDEVSEADEFDDDDGDDGQVSSESDDEEVLDESGSDAADASASDASSDKSDVTPHGTKRRADKPDAKAGADSGDLLSQLQTRQAQDVRKGRDVQKQVHAWEQALRTRIAMQKINTQVGRLPPSHDVAACLDAAPEARAALDTAAADLEEIASTLLSIRMRLWEQNLPALRDVLATRVNTEASASKAVRDLEAAIEPHRRMLLSRWSNKIAAAPDSRNAPGAKLQLRAMNQGVVEQMDQALSGDGLARLVERTRVWRATDVDRVGGATPVAADARAAQDVDVFDDSDFYAQLLRDLVDNAGLVQAGTSAFANEALHAKKRKRAVDVRASKGRRIRYQVLDKVQNFMPPIPRVTWSDDQAERLFARLAGARPEAEADDGASEAPEAPEALPVADGFRLFA
ncbi:rRNA-processing protein bfr2 [Malassezia brasiliensis]|uniref:Protein BFR2 n=1 Tax=Malassezia brasiliensis TaxID=1821822 RepID=A0AAF0DPH0_9BASI|nr:rRNA-processing protein bfr2 [Malassezia brasiliensis]